MQDYFKAFKTVSKRDDYIYVQDKKMYTQNRYIQLGMPCDLNIADGAYPRKEMDAYLQGRSEKFPSPLDVNVDIRPKVENYHLCHNIEQFDLLAKTSQTTGSRQYIHVKNKEAMIVDQGVLLYVPVDVPYDFVCNASLANVIAKLAPVPFYIGFNGTNGSVKIFDIVISFEDILLTYPRNFDTMFKRNTFEDASGFKTKNTDARRVIKTFGGKDYEISRSTDIFKVQCSNGTRIYWLEKEGE